MDSINLLDLLTNFYVPFTLIGTISLVYILLSKKKMYRGAFGRLFYYLLVFFMVSCLVFIVMYIESLKS